jgi:hypothetical protein
VPGEPHDPGSIREGWYTVDGDGLLTMTDMSGEPILRGDGTRFTSQLQPGDDPDVHARRLIRSIMTMLPKRGVFDGYRWPPNPRRYDKQFA